jgi:hypothetical protein
MAFQIRAMAVFRSVNFFTGANGSVFQTATNRAAGQPSVTAVRSSMVLIVAGWPVSGTVSPSAKAVMRLSLLITNALILKSFLILLI